MQNSEDKMYTCCFFGHRNIDKTKELEDRLCKGIEDLIINKKVDTFLFGSKSEFYELCLNIVTKLKEKYSYIKRIYVRAAFQYINDDYRDYLLESYDDTYYPDHIENSGKAAYVERNFEMVDKSRYCIVYYDEKYILQKGRKSGTEIACKYAQKKERDIINVFLKD